MSKGKILFVDTDESLMNLVRVYLEAQGYIVQVFSNGKDALAEAQSDIPPDAVIIGNTQFRKIHYELTINSQTNLIPVIFLLTREERDNVIFGMLEPHDIITKPFDLRELELRIANQIEQSKRPRLISPTTGFPTGALIEKHLRDLILKFAAFTFIELKIQHFAEFKEIYSWQAGNEVMKTSSLMITDILEEYGSQDDFAGQLGECSFVLMSHAKDVNLLIESLKSRFNTEILGHYSFIDRERGSCLWMLKKFP